MHLFSSLIEFAAVISGQQILTHVLEDGMYIAGVLRKVGFVASFQYRQSEIQRRGSMLQSLMNELVLSSFGGC
ncbi:hypothetical protein A5647_15795 [Mycobacterium sp. 1100029.7]|nr:hypothetical protein A5647_15795 [Mycobacterium sp. 1100029.7]